MKHARSVAQRLLSATDYPSEILSSVPVVEIKGRSEAVVSGHRGILAYGQTEIRVASSGGSILIVGEGLTIRTMNRERIILRGRIRRVEMEAVPC